jgi:uroporphyrinogen decarboxylase
MVLGPFDFSAIAEAFGGEAAFFRDQPPNMRRPAAQSATQALGLPLPEPEQAGRLPFILEATRRLAELYRDRVPVFVPVPGAASLPALLTGLGPWMEALLFDESTARSLLERTGRFFARWCNALLESGATGLVVTEGLAAEEVTPRSLFAERLLPHVRAMFAEVRGPLVFHHTGGRIGHLLDLLAGLPNLAGVAVSSKDDLASARQAIGPGPLLIGNLDNLGYSAASPDEIRVRCRACLEAAAPSGRFILANAGGDIPLDTPPANLRAMLEASSAHAAASVGR